MSATDDKSAFVTVSGFGSGHVFRTSDQGAHWSAVSGNLPDAPANAVAVDYSGPAPVLYVATDVGVLWSANAASVSNWDTACTLTVWVYPLGTSGNTGQSFAPWTAGNLNSTLRNNEASQTWSGPGAC